MLELSYWRSQLIVLYVFRSGSELAWSALPDKQESPRQRRSSPPGNTPTQAPGSPRVKRSSSFSSKAQPVSCALLVSCFAYVSAFVTLLCLPNASINFSYLCTLGTKIGLTKKYLSIKSTNICVMLIMCCMLTCCRTQCSPVQRCL